MTRSTIWAATLLVALALPAAADDGPSPADAAAQRLVEAEPGAVLAAFASFDPALREAAAAAVGLRGSASAREVAELIAATGDEALAVRMAATRALGKVGDVAAPAVPRLERLAGWASVVEQRRAAVLSLARIPSADEALRRVFLDDGLRDKTFVGLALLDGAAGLPVLLRLAAAPEWRIRRGAVRVLPGATGARESAAVRTALTARLVDVSSAVRVATLLALREIDAGDVVRSTHVERAFGPDGSETERRALLVAIQAGQVAARAEAIRRSAASTDAREALAAVRLAHASRTWDDATLLAIAGVATREAAGPAREAAACLRHAGIASPLAPDVAEALRPALAHESLRVRAEAAAALALGGHDGPHLAQALTRLLIAHAAGGWSEGPIRAASAPLWGRGHRNLRAGGTSGAVTIPALDAVSLLTLDALTPLLRRHPEAALDALGALLSHEWAATRVNAAWMLADVADDGDVAERLVPLLDDASLDVRICAGVRLARLGVQPEAIARTFVTLLAGDGLDDEVIGGGDDRAAFNWTSDMIEVLPHAPRASVAALVDAYRATQIDVDGDTWSESLPGRRHVQPIFRALGAAGYDALIDELLAGDGPRRMAVRAAFADAGVPDATTRERLAGLLGRNDVGDDVRRILARLRDSD